MSGQESADRIGELPPVDWDAIRRNRQREEELVATALAAAGTPEAAPVRDVLVGQVAVTPGELDALPDQTIVRIDGHSGAPAVKFAGMWLVVFLDAPLTSNDLLAGPSVTVLYRPDAPVVSAPVPACGWAAGAELLTRIASDRELPCLGGACEGPDVPFESMVTCRSCAAVQDARTALAAADVDATE